VSREASAATPARETAREPAPGACTVRPASPAHQRVLALQHAAGNRAVSRMVAAGKLPPGIDDEEGEVPVGGWFGDLWKSFVGKGASPPTLPSPAPAAGVTPASPKPPSAATATPVAAPPPKLSKTVVSGPTPRDCGGWKWVVQWKLDKPTKTGGWVVQRVDATRDVKDDKDKPVPVTNGWDPSWTPYWEGWKINAGQSITTYAETGDVEDDTYAGTAGGVNTRGTFTMRGRAEFYEGATLPATMKPTNSAPAWILPFTKTDPSLAGGTGAIDHDLTATWDCTTANKSTTITTK